MGCMGPELPNHTISRPSHLFISAEVTCSACDIMQIFGDTVNSVGVTEFPRASAVSDGGTSELW